MIELTNRSIEASDDAHYKYYRTLSENEALQLLLDLIIPENQMRPLSSDLREFIHLLNTNSVEWAATLYGRSRFGGRKNSFTAFSCRAASQRKGVFLHTMGVEKATALIVQ